MTKALCYGVDLGTTNSCISIFYDDEEKRMPKSPIVVENKESQLITPSVVSFGDNNILVGARAARNRSENPTNTFYHIKRLIGRKYSDPTLSKDRKTYPYAIKKSEKGLPFLPINTERYKDIKLPPEQISGMVLSYLKESADLKCIEKTNKVVVTVPANFNDYQRRATMDAAKIALQSCLCHQ